MTFDHAFDLKLWQLAQEIVAASAGDVVDCLDWLRVRYAGKNVFDSATAKLGWRVKGYTYRGKKREMRLPNERVELTTVGCLQRGQGGYIAPWGLYAGPDAELYLYEYFSVTATPGGDTRLRIEKDVAGLFSADLSTCSDYVWRPAVAIEPGSIKVDAIFDDLLRPPLEPENTTNLERLTARLEVAAKAVMGVGDAECILIRDDLKGGVRIDLVS